MNPTPQLPFVALCVIRLADSLLASFMAVPFGIERDHRLRSSAICCSLPHPIVASRAYLPVRSEAFISHTKSPFDKVIILLKKG